MSASTQQQPLVGCPFCGDFPTKYMCPQKDAWRKGVPSTFRVHCQCGAAGKRAASAQEAAKLWNTRAALSPPSDNVLRAIRVWRDAEAKAEEARGEKMFMGKPDAWYEDRHWFCSNGHVSGCFLKSEEDGDLCLACQEPVVLGPPITEAQFAPILAALRSLTSNDARSNAIEEAAKVAERIAKESVTVDDADVARARYEGIIAGARLIALHIRNLSSPVEGRDG